MTWRQFFIHFWKKEIDSWIQFTTDRYDKCFITNRTCFHKIFRTKTSRDKLLALVHLLGGQVYVAFVIKLGWSTGLFVLSGQRSPNGGAIAIQRHSVIGCAGGGMTFDAVDFILIIPSLLHFLHREPIDVLCAHSAPSFLSRFHPLLWSCRLANVTSHVFPLPSEQSN